MLGLLAVMLVGSITAGAAWAEPGPFWHHRNNPKEEAGFKIEPNAPENFSGNGGRQTLTSEPAKGTKIELTSAATQVKDSIFNGPHQGQIKQVIFYQQPEVKINGEVPKECKASIGQQGQFSDIVQLKGHLAWKWDGTKQQLEEQPQRQQKWDIIFTQTEPQRQSEKEFPLIDLRTAAGSFAEINLKGTGCGVLAGVQKVGGSEVALPSPSQLEEWSKKLTLRTIPAGTLPSEILGTKVEGEGFLQHVWVGQEHLTEKEFQPLILGLTFAGKSANLIGQTEMEAAQQEIAVFEK